MIPRSPRKSGMVGRLSTLLSNNANPWILFVLGCLLGHWHGRSFRTAISLDDVFRNGGTSLLSARTAAATPASCVPDGNGWRSIQIFYGTPHVPMLKPSANRNTTVTKNDTAVTTSSPESQSSSPQRQLWFSQARQDELVAGLLRYKTHGYFIDLAANDAWTLSNTYALEERYGWDGVCIEPNPVYWYNLTQRRCRTVGAVVGSAERMEDVYFRFDAGDHGGIADTGFDNGRRWQSSSEHRYTVPLLEILRDRVQAPVDIDYLSLDVEGAETFVLTHFPLDHYRIKIITAERLKGEVRGYLKDHGYEFVMRLTRWGESLWVHSSVRDDLDWSVLEQFQFPL